MQIENPLRPGGAKFFRQSKRNLQSPKDGFFQNLFISGVFRAFFIFGLISALEGCSRDLPAAHNYDGSTETILKLADDVSLETYTIDFKLRSASAAKDEAEYGETTPPMPFLVKGGIAAAHIGDKYLITIRGASGKYAIRSRFGDSSEYTRITLAAAKDGVVLYVNGGEAARTERPAIPLRGFIRVGAGFKQRFWRGEYQYFDVYNSLQTLGEFDPDAGRFDEGERILALDSK